MIAWLGNGFRFVNKMAQAEAFPRAYIMPMHLLLTLMPAIRTRRRKYWKTMLFDWWTNILYLSYCVTVGGYLSDSQRIKSAGVSLHPVPSSVTLILIRKMAFDLIQPVRRRHGPICNIVFTFWIGGLQGTITLAGISSLDKVLNVLQFIVLDWFTYASKLFGPSGLAKDH